MKPRIELSDAARSLPTQNHSMIVVYEKLSCMFTASVSVSPLILDKA